MLKVNPIAHLIGELCPLVSVHHHVLTTSIIIVVNAYLLAYILLGNAERFLHRQLYRQSVSVPSCLTLHLITLHSLIAQEGIFDGTSHHVVNTRMTISRRWSLKEDELRTAVLLCYTFVEDVVLLPLCKYFFIGLYKVQTFMFSKFLTHLLYCGFLITLFSLTVLALWLKRKSSAVPKRLHTL